MSPLALWTRVAIGVLIVGPIVVFAWFLRDAWRLMKAVGQERRDARGYGQGARAREDAS